MPPKSNTSDKITNEDILMELKEITSNLGIIINKIEELNLITREASEKKETRQSTEQVSQSLEQLCTNLHSIFVNNSEKFPQQDTRNENTPTSTLLIKSRINHNWNKNLIARKFAFWNMLKNNNKAEIYERWINATPLVLPRKLQINPIPEEPEIQRQLREKLALEKMQTEIKLLKLRASNNEQKFKTIDEEMHIELSKNAEGQPLENVLKLWKESTETQELTSLQRWEKNDTFFHNYEAQFKAEYSSDNPYLKKTRVKSYSEINKRPIRSNYRHPEEYNYIKPSSNFEINRSQNKNWNNPQFGNTRGGGIAVGSVVLIEEDTFGHYGQLLLKYFLSEAIMTGQSILLAGTEINPESILKELPKPVVDDVTPAQSNMMQTDEMKIAWRYQHLNKYQSNPTAVKFGHYYDLSQYMDEDLVSDADVTLITSEQLSQKHLHEVPPDIEPANPEVSACLQCLLLHIQQRIQDGQFGTQDQPEKHNVLRIAIPSLGSPLWGNLKTSESDGLLSVVDTDLLRFLLALRAILRSSFAVCMVTVPSLIMEDANFIHKIERLCDAVVHLESFAGSSRSENPLYKEYHGLFHVKQLPKLNAIRCQMPDTTDWAFKLRRKKFIIEKLHLPPDLSETVSRSESRPTVMGLSNMGCGGSGHGHLDF